MYHKTDGTIGFQFKPRNDALHLLRYKGTIETLPQGDSLIVLPNLGFNDHMRLTKDTITILRNFPEEHHVYE